MRARGNGRPRRAPPLPRVRGVRLDLEQMERLRGGHAIVGAAKALAQVEEAGEGEPAVGHRSISSGVMSQPVTALRICSDWSSS